VLLLATRLVPESRRDTAERRYDPLGALSVTAGLVALVYAISEAPDVGWATFRTIGLIALGAALLVVFLVVETRTRAPLVPLRIFRIRLLTAANVIGFLQASGLFATFFLLTLYLQQVLRYSALEAGLGFLATAGTAVLMAGPAQMLATRLGPKPVLALGLALLGSAILWYTQIDPNGSYAVDLLPGFVAYGIGIPFTFIPINIAALAGVAPHEAGLASGLINTSQQVGGAIGVAVASTIAFTHSETLIADGTAVPVALTEGFKWGFWTIAGLAAAAIVATLLLIRRDEIDPVAAAEAPAQAAA